MKIGFFDSGIGGLTVLHQALKLLPDEDYLFYADSAHVPYGEKPKEEVKQYIAEAVRFIFSQGAEALVIACNTATSIAVQELRMQYDYPILGIEPAVKPAVRQVEGTPKKVLVLATPLTLQEDKYHNLVKRLDSRDIVDSLALPGLVRLAERFDFREESVRPYLREQFAGLELCKYGTVVLGCTHFPYFIPVLRQLFPPQTQFISGNTGTARNLKAILGGRTSLGSGSGRIEYYASGSRVDDEVLLSQYAGLLKRLDPIQ
ncbi:glutamate racemase [Paenibacillus tengchongensis]|uniref:glutamate racemase n=1 Tax=Paenibacillus tengchongensis TaxID=2608684 RepID=UPI00124ED27B|nr:glutamate racemase [Paenibacillus tengchongensis]